MKNLQEIQNKTDMKRGFLLIHNLSDKYPYLLIYYAFLYFDFILYSTIIIILGAIQKNLLIRNPLQKCRFTNLRAFSLMELLIVIAIIGIISSIATMKYQSYIRETKAETVKIMLMDIKVSQKSCFYTYPPEECNSLEKLDIDLPPNYTPRVISSSDSSRVCFEVKNSINQYGCYDSVDKNISTVEDIINKSKGKCNSSASCL